MIKNEFSSNKNVPTDMNRKSSTTFIINERVELTSNAIISSKKNKIAKLGFFVFFIFALTLAKMFGPPTASVDCIQDNLMIFFQPVNNFIRLHNRWRDIFQILSSAIIDIAFLLTAVPWVFRGTTGRMFYCFILFYLIRFVTQKLITFEFTSGYLWSYPGFPSLIVPYGQDNVFFFSGQVGFLMIIGCENWAIGMKWLFTLSMIGEIYLIFILLSYQLHYSSDIIAGLFISHWTFMVINKYSPIIDKFLISAYAQAHEKIMESSILESETETDADSVNQKNSKSVTFFV